MVSRGGSAMTTATNTAANDVTTRGTAKPAVTPKVSASTGIVNAQTPMPNGCAICRTPIAVPRRSGGNHPTTMRPPAPLVAAEVIPATSRHAPRITVGASKALARQADPVAATVNVSDSSKMRRSPKRSSATPQAMVASSRPTMGTAARVEAAVSDIPSDRCSSGIRKAIPLTTHVVAIAAVREAASIARRLVSVGTAHLH